jgi:hypothetical protein
MTDYHAGTGQGEEGLEDALSNLRKGDRVFITFDEYAKCHSHDGEQRHEFDDVDKLALAHLALAFGCVAKLEDAERRIYFSKI